MNLAKVAVCSLFLLPLMSSFAYSKSQYENLVDTWKDLNSDALKITEDINFTKAMPIRGGTLGSSQDKFSLLNGTNTVITIDGMNLGPLFSDDYKYREYGYDSVFANHSFKGLILKNGNFVVGTDITNHAGGGAYGFYQSRLEKNWTSGEFVIKKYGRIQNATFNNISFISNSVTGGSNTYGGAVFISPNDTTHESNVYFSSGTVFEGNSAYHGGGYAALVGSGAAKLSTYFNADTSTESKTTVTFKNNRATGGDGGGIYASGNVFLDFNTDILFDSNTARGSGGAIYKDTEFNVEFGSQTYSVEAAFQNNTAQTGAGGAIYSKTGDITFYGNSIFKSNSSAQDGGAVYTGGNKLYFSENSDADKALFLNNTSYSGSGGAIYAYDALSNFHDLYFYAGADFKFNSAGLDGGAIKIVNDNAKFEFMSYETDASSATSYFEGNTAGRSGGAISASGARSNIAFYRGASFESNTAGLNGGAIETGANASITFNFFHDDGAGTKFEYNTASAGSGGAIYAGGYSGINFCDTSLFEGNKAGLNGGAIYLESGNIMFASYTNALTRFDSNTAVSGKGGALYYGGSNALSFGGDVIFTHNSAGTGGGAIYTKTANIEFKADTLFDGNKTTLEKGHGGAIFKDSVGYITFHDTGTATYFQNNKASGAGGAIYSGGGTINFKQDVSFLSNSAALGGGAIYNEKASTVNFDKAALFSRNSSLSGTSGDGAALVFKSSYSNVLMFKDMVLFSSNTGSGSGGGIYFGGGNITFSTAASFAGNTATSGGGAMFTRNSVVKFNDIIGFENNFTEGTGNFSSGGAIYSDNSTYAFAKGVLFDSNGTNFARGGAVYAYGSSFTFTNISAKDNPEYVTVFVGNTTNANDPEGGAAIYSANSIFNFNSSANIFSNNETLGYTSVSGGAVYSVNSLMNFLGDTSFSENKASAMGGAIALADSNVNFESDVFFTSNTGQDGGGAVYLAGSTGGSLNFKENVYFGGDDEVDGNKTTSSVLKGGGAIYIGTISGDHTVDFAQNKTVLFKNNSAEIGGAVSAYSGAENTLNFNSTTSFINNSARSDGGAIYSSAYGTGETTYNFEKITFDSNTSGNSGGAIYSLGDNVFNLDNYMFIRNSADGTDGSGGGAVYASGSEINFITASSGTYPSIYGNTTKGRGGAIYQVDSKINFASEVNFVHNQADGSGGAMYASGGETTFDESVNFQENESNGDILSAGGGALYLSSNAVMKFKKNAGFNGNTSVGTSNGSGGAIYSSSSSLTFGDKGQTSTVTFVNNVAMSKGGAVFQSSGNSVFNAAVKFETNASAYGGGALYVSDNADITFNESAEFLNNFTYGSINSFGGALYSENSSIEFKKASLFLGNKVRLNGGALYVSGGSVEFKEASSFSNNGSLSGHGGAFYVTGKSKLTLNDAVVYGNTAALNGGAFYVSGVNAANKAEVYFNQTDADSLNFSGNKANGVSNAIYLAGNSYFNMNIASGKTFDMIDGISGESDDNRIVIRGGGVFNLAGKFTAYKSIDLDLDNIEFNMPAGSVLETASLSVSSAMLNAQNGTVDKILVSGDFSADSGSSVKLDVFADGSNDTIVSDGKAFLGGELYVKAGVGTYDNKWFTLISADGGFSGTDFFKKLENCSQIDALYPCTLKYNFEFSQDGKNILFVVNGIRKSNFSAVAKSKNQRSIALAVDAVSEKASRAYANVINGIVENMSLERQADALAQKTPYFLSNVINAQVQGNKRWIFGQIKEDKDSALNIWGHGNADSVEFTENENSVGKFSGNSYGISFGADKYFDPLNGTVGLFGNYSDGDMEQYGSKADVLTAGGGIYGVWSLEKWEFRGLLDFETQSYDTKRRIYIPENSINSTAKADFSGFSFGADIESAYKVSLNKIFELKPYAGLNFTSIKYDGFSETGAGPLDLEVESGDMLASNVRLGVGVSGQIQKFGFGARVEYEYLLSGFEPEIKSSLADTSVFPTVGAEIGRNIAAFNIGADYEVLQNFKVYATGIYKAGEDLTNFYGNFGVRYSFK